MQAPYRIAAPLAPEPPDPVDAYEALLLARARRGRLVVALVACAFGGLMVAALGEAHTPPSARRELARVRAEEAARVEAAREIIASARARAASEQRRFEHAVRAATYDDADDAEAETTLARGPSWRALREGAACRAPLPDPTALLRGRRGLSLVVARPGEPVESPSAAAILADVQRAEYHLANGHRVDWLVYADALEATSVARRLRYDVALVTTSVKPPVRTTTSSYEPGRVEGRAYVYGFAEGRVVCAGEVHATSSRQVEYQYVPDVGGSGWDGPLFAQGPSLSGSLGADLDLQVQRAIVGGALHTVP